MGVELQIKASAQGSEVTASTGSVADAAEMGKLVDATALPVRLLDQAVAERFSTRVESSGPSSRILVVSVGKRGINFVNGNIEVIRQLQDVLSLLHNSVIEFFTGTPHFLNLTLRELGEPAVWVPVSTDGLEDLPKKVPVRTDRSPRSCWSDPPDWFIEGCKKLFPNAGWGDKEVSDAETAITCFNSYPFLDHWGWVSRVRSTRVVAKDLPTSLEEWRANGKKKHFDLLEQEDTDADCLISEPYGLNEKQTLALVDVCNKTGWTWNIKGVSAHAPSSTMRIEIYPRVR